ncbi:MULTISPECIES: DUF2795 domain-containing protein [Micromonospora]|uniref:DUF2795 domain-containing protein n=1 Tax=Micromonospora tarensis TaxID=2806100 RepID=A0ABS1YCS7_9ACTN|nr:DUF2795 domain-containing protein [Micromonospora tarensis]MBM0202409.1 DUF2795 domain-containing protein [Micromonospora sp. STR1s_5]MBM0275184.1 DUF2795 domain-containing protein [Micromonospora tarensis]
MHDVTRIELLDHVRTAFDDGPASRNALLAAAAASNARPEVIALLNRLPERDFRQVRDLWEEMADVPVGA